MNILNTLGGDDSLERVWLQNKRRKKQMVCLRNRTWAI